MTTHILAAAHVDGTTDAATCNRCQTGLNATHICHRQHMVTCSTVCVSSNSSVHNRSRDTKHIAAASVHAPLWQASSLFKGLGNTYEKRQSADIGNYLAAMSASLGNLGGLVPALAGPVLPCDGPLPALEGPAGEVLYRATLDDIMEARVAVNAHWTEAIATASNNVQDALGQLSEAITPSWKTNLQPSATWQNLIDSCGPRLSTIDTAAILAIHSHAKKARDPGYQPSAAAVSAFHNPGCNNA